METRRPMCGEGLAQEGDVIRRRSGVDGREAGKCASPTRPGLALALVSLVIEIH